MRHLPFILLLSLAATSVATAQRVLVVDGNLGPGTNYADIASAVSAAQPGDVVAVRPGAYAGFSVSKPLSLTGAVGVTINQPNGSGEGISIANLPAGTDLMLRGFTISTGSGAGLGVRNCAGRVLLDEIIIPVGSANTVSDCFQVLANQSVFTGMPTSVTRSTVTLSGSTLIGSNSSIPSPGLSITDSEVVLAQSAITGGSALPPLVLAPAPAIQMSNSQVTITDDGSNVIAAGNAAAQSRAAVEGFGNLALDTKVVLRPAGSATAVASSISVSTENIPSLVATGAEPGGVATVKLTGGTQDLFFLLVGVPGDAIPFPSLQGSIWLDPNLIFIVSAGDLRPSGTVTLSIVVTNNPAAAGRPLQWLGIAGPDIANLRLTNNVGYIHGSL